MRQPIDHVARVGFSFAEGSRMFDQIAIWMGEPSRSPADYNAACVLSTELYCRWFALDMPVYTTGFGGRMVPTGA